MRAIVPINQLGSRIPEQGRIRLGVKLPKGMKSIDTFRFTSPDAEAIGQIAALYGGTVRPWDDPKARVRNQMEVITTTNQIRVMLPPDPLSQHYELWTAGGVTRRCDGVEVEVPNRQTSEMDTVPCICWARQQRECKLHTRLNVILPEVRFGGVWRLESKGHHVGEEMPGMQEMISNLQAIGIMEAQLTVEQRTSVAFGKTQHYVVPVLSPAHSPDELLAGQGRVQALARLPEPEMLAPGDPMPGTDTPKAIASRDVTPPDPWAEDADIVDAEVVEPFDTPAERLMKAQAMDMLNREVPPLDMKKARTAFLLGCKGLAAMVPDRSDEDVRHALSWWASGKGSNDSSTMLDETQLRKALKAVDDFTSGKVPEHLLVKIVDDYAKRDF